jgi:hypothetical protein
MSRMWWLAVPVVLVVVGVAAAGCANTEPGGLRADRRVSDLGPRLETVTNPVTISWDADFEPGEASGLWFVVHVDTSMVPPRSSIIEHAGATCADVPACIEAGQVFDHGRYLTDRTDITLDLFPGERRVTVLLVNREGIRETDSAWNTRFTVAEP